jgi:hypothetical protein
MDGVYEPGGMLPIEELAADLCRLLAKQVVCAREGNLPQFERLGELTGQAVAQIAQLLRDDAVLSEDSRASLQSSYHELLLVLQAESNGVRDSLRQLRQFRKVVTAYRNRADGYARVR